MTRLLSILCLIPSLLLASPFTFVQQGDDHYNGDADNIRLDLLTNNAWCFQHTNDGVLNIVGKLNCGDRFNQDSETILPTNYIVIASNTVNHGIFEFSCNGNHDCDSPDGSASGSHVPFSGSSFNWMNFFPVSWYQRQTNISGVGYAGTRVVNDSRDVAMLYTNQGYKFIFLSVAWATNLLATTPNTNNPAAIRTAYAAQMQWVTNMLGAYSNHIGVVLTHWGGIASDGTIGAMYDTGATLYSNIGPSVALLDIIPQCKNLDFVFCGHHRGRLKLHGTIRNGAGQPCQMVQLDTQSFSNRAAVVSLVTFVPEMGTVYFKTFDTINNRYMTNGEVAFDGNGFTTGIAYTHSWQAQIPKPNGPSLIRAFRLQ